MNSKSKKELFETIEIARESLKNSMEIYLETYAEILSKFDKLIYLIKNN